MIFCQEKINCANVKKKKKLLTLNTFSFLLSKWRKTCNLTKTTGNKKNLRMLLAIKWKGQES